MFRLRKFIAIVLAFSAFGLAAAAQQTWNIDPRHSAAQFAVRHLGISTVRGQFNRMAGSVQYDPSNVSNIAINATMDASSIDTRIEMRDKDLRGEKYFDVEKYPTITFKSKSVQQSGPGKLKVIGDLTMHGVTREVALDVEGPSAPLKDARGTERMGASATTKLNRRDFGINGGAAVVSDEVAITLDLELVKAPPDPSAEQAH